MLPLHASQVAERTFLHAKGQVFCSLRFHWIGTVTTADRQDVRQSGLWGRRASVLTFSEKCESKTRR